jgi:ribosomal protein L16 Arg81 hydroxylase|tara:strand:- start:322 stop:945 length:624 start_codon:yes stop_codon:yes gene_type:complete
MILNKSIIKLIKEKKPFCINVSNLENLYSKKEFENYINTTHFSINTNLDARRVKKKYVWNANVWDHKSFVTKQLLEELLKKETIAITLCRKASKNISLFVSELEKLTNLPTDCHMYYCSKETNEKGLSRHNDSNDNLMVQIFGKTLFKVWLNNKIYINKILKPGDLCYVPRKVDHCFESITERLSLSFPMSYPHKVNKNNQDYWITL